MVFRRQIENVEEIQLSNHYFSDADLFFPLCNYSRRLLLSVTLGLVWMNIALLPSKSEYSLGRVINFV